RRVRAFRYCRRGRDRVVHRPRFGGRGRPPDRCGGDAAMTNEGPFTLAIDIGGTGLKATVLDRGGAMIVPRVRVAPPHPSPPRLVVRRIGDLGAPLPAYDRISIGFPGVVRGGCVITAPNLGTKDWHEFPLQETIAAQLGKPCRMLNDAEVQALGIVTGKGL